MNKISKWAIIPLLAGTLTFPQLTQAEQTSISVYVNDNKVVFDQNPVIHGDITLVPLRGVFEKLGAKVDWEQATQAVKVTKEDKTITLKKGSKDAFINNILQKLDTEPQLLNNRIMVPLRFISETLDAKVDWNGTTRTITITQPTSTQQTSTNSNSNISIPKNENSTTLTYNDALQKALAYSYALKNAEKEIDKADESRDDYGEFFRYSEPFGTGNSLEDAQIRQIYLGMLSADDKVRKAKRDLETTKEEITYQVKQAYNDVIQKEASKLYNEKALAVEELNFKLAKVQLTQGVISQVQYDQLANKLDGTKKTLEASEKALSQAKIKLNQLMGVSSNNTYALVDIPAFETMENADVDYQITKTLEKHPTIFELEQAKNLTQKSLDLYTYNSGSIGENYETKRITVSTLGNQIAQTKDSIAQGVRTTYLNIKSLEDQYAILQTNLSNAEKSLQVTKVQYEVGQTTELDLRQKELQLADLQSKVTDTIVKLDSLHAVYEKPWVAMGASSTAQ
ncbi:outer membrane protein [Schinkia azotoformans MEV2011]|uniref:Outer membrane protein n=1 Tax=Schinkia azotoformans MEV2011 TaxID=1348973 RepID=A0A072NMZ4_SCHAZ|nr:stalk domain-containing protein [Schinkia azotoformans]KEF38836.1 outer membrane protein [Schinkia azotoformans MEV2011]MEC1696740.1 stalk domain-containing protein [Schinkia azotoformans]MEC1725051.1 stalk domain-containing protein [Schinkia azotoformans]MEC1741710.1 stalk domain-containing protein [Schinkia azotoformans]MEC1766612.1 stalk domain-containing protein [Schinkia azotoformans]